MTINPARADTLAMLKMEPFKYFSSVVFVLNSFLQLENGSADITLRTINQEHPRQEQVDFTVPIGILYHGYFVKESTHVEVGDYLGDAFFGTVSRHIH
ncbi:unnamed protein product [Cylicostephanus goldi]|uniref:Uncharacterized protein n=1 Tax=Cylicostephanus goldi TaxID=71465 RepID=A0A3P6S038_CYLGO|nr:unnamed protein product [Cylicostephanus goldi]